MTYQPSREMFPVEAVSLQDKMQRLRQEIVEAEQHRLLMDAAPTAEKYKADRRISEMQARLTQLLDRFCD